MDAEGPRRHFGVLSFTGSGHLNPLIAVGLNLQERGHRITFFEKPKIERRIREAGLGFYAIVQRESPFKGKGPAMPAGGVLSELATLRFNLRRIKHDLENYFKESEPALRETGVDALIVNEIAITGPTLAELLGLPYFIVSTSVPHNFGWNAYPAWSGYRSRRSWYSAFQAAVLEVSSVKMHGPIRSTVNRFRASRGLAPVSGINPSYPPLAQITQLPKCLDVPRSSFPRYFRYTGPFDREGSRPRIDFPWDRLDGRPLIYASLGTTRNAQADVLRLIAEACKEIDAQLVISLGGRFDAAAFGPWPGEPVVVEFAPQLEILKRASLVITHAGPNTVFETLMEGKPMVAIPVAHDQPAIAARLARLGIAEVLPIMRLSAGMIRRAAVKVLQDDSYRRAAEEMQKELRNLNGVQRAVEIIEESLARPEMERKLVRQGLDLREPSFRRLSSTGRG
jgi:zeaxanthin glucosyltransferase